ncbi:phage shock protein A, PspA [Spirochaeta thermophila DSM 6578]|uniref:Phage shock protein A, PspA n=1 Tax=Winmispira thermophila (strain ATCC 700085 / DSM 6578 / Z-1203) TaxID=869211 RepID=G0GBH4_WINT7|nr:PspA/IM30 family protein [Spirochaeta thermophila]AEJ60333.1 phage shock protein A, PspA [Spirochaeta thermophila DSM 6578]
MGFFQRLVRAVKAQFNALLKRIEDPEKLLDQLLLDMNKQLLEAKRSVAQALADEKRLEKRVSEYAAQVDDWEQKAVTALKAGREDLAKQALVKKAELLEVLEQYRKSHEEQHATVEKLKASLRDLQDRIEDARRKRNILIARAKRVQAQKRLQETIKGLSDTSAFAAFEELEKRVEELEAEAEATEALEVEDTTLSLEEQIRKLEKPEDKADVLLEDLKKRLGLPHDSSGS